MNSLMIVILFLLQNLGIRTVINMIQNNFNLKFIYIIILSGLIISCNTVSLTEMEASQLSHIKAEIVIEKFYTESNLKNIYVTLSNGEKFLINENIEVFLNSKPLHFFVRTGNYNDKYPIYRSQDLLKEDSYYFEIKLADGTLHPLAFIKPSAFQTNFNIPNKFSLDKDFVFTWRNNKHETEVTIWKLVHQKDNLNENSGGRHASSTQNIVIREEDGIYTLPISFYEDSLTVANHIKVNISQSEDGLINPNLIGGSSIYYKVFLEKTVVLEK